MDATDSSLPASQETQRLQAAPQALQHIWQTLTKNRVKN